jgi:uncharacterized phage-associated protein
VHPAIVNSADFRVNGVLYTRHVQMLQLIVTISDMTSAAPYDPRAVANLLLEVLEGKGRPPTHIQLQKLLYFAHGRFLRAENKPLVSGYFEAWEYGPVHPAVYQAFKGARERRIDFRAVRTNLLTGQQVVVEPPDSPDARRHIEAVASDYGLLSTRQLVDLSHASNAPWDQTLRRVSNEIALGARISNDVIKEWFQRHKIDIGSSSRSGGPLKDAPLTGNRSRQYRLTTVR